MSRQRLVALRLQISPAPGRGASQRRSVAPGDAGPELRPSIKQSEAAGSHHLPPATTNTGTSMKLLLIIGESSPHRSDNKQRKIAFPGINKHANARNCYHIISLQSKKCKRSLDFIPLSSTDCCSRRILLLRIQRKSRFHCSKRNL